ncbi:glycerophosphodiester phosphodiesterase [Actinomadura syzygii]|uniref:Glycerophosphodiester phosphodiesterase n=1 Tax=Actinomadura syzygii TaxID=1427538 RepID=A0A5D0UJ59_9ACTN|nr:glycerophosphodiester phosphodiesterase family protein [Actinomadura syzygii]TYC18541.1 glycerophosphodiester phosphodiesterase [Actinomadura syzygii]
MHRRNRLALFAVTASAAVVVPATPATAGPVSVSAPLRSSPQGAPEPPPPGAPELTLPGAPEPRPRTVAALTALSAGVTDVAHRGASAYAPENTLAAFRLAKDKKADVFEFDVQESKDHKLVIMHDTTLTRTTNVEQVFPGRKSWKVSAFTLAEIRKLDAGSWFGKKFKGERVPTLDQVLSEMDGGGLGLLLEIKSPELYPGIEKRIAASLRGAPSWLRTDPAERRLVVQSFDWESVRRFHAELPKVPTGLIGTPKTADLPKLAAYADQINPPYGDLTASYVKKVHAAKMDLQTWTVDDPAAMRKAIGLGVDGVISNKPDVLRRVLQESARKTARKAA